MFPLFLSLLLESGGRFSSPQHSVSPTHGPLHSNSLLLASVQIILILLIKQGHCLSFVKISSNGFSKFLWKSPLTIPAVPGSSDKGLVPGAGVQGASPCLTLQPPVSPSPPVSLHPPGVTTLCARLASACPCLCTSFVPCSELSGEDRERRQSEGVTVRVPKGWVRWGNAWRAEPAGLEELEGQERRGCSPADLQEMGRKTRKQICIFKLMTVRRKTRSRPAGSCASLSVCPAAHSTGSAAVALNSRKFYPVRRGGSFQPRASSETGARLLLSASRRTSGGSRDRSEARGDANALPGLALPAKRGDCGVQQPPRSGVGWDTAPVNIRGCHGCGGCEDRSTRPCDTPRWPRALRGGG